MTIVKTFKKALICLIFAILALWICGYAFYLLHIKTLKPNEASRKTDAIIVLTGGNLRITKGLELFTEKMATHLFISGVHNLVTDEEIINMWGGKKLPECCIVMGRDATTTIGNAKETHKWLKNNNEIKTIRLVTSNYHMPRALLEFNAILKDTDIKIITHPVIDKSIKNYFSLVFGEYNKTLFRWSIITLTTNSTI